MNCERPDRRRRVAARAPAHRGIASRPCSASPIVVVFAVTLMVGNTFYGPVEVLRVILGETVPGASFTVGELRLPRATMGVLAGFAFGIAGVTFQTMLRNPLASPDIIGISSGASAAAVFGIVVLALDETAVSFLALGGRAASPPPRSTCSRNRGGFAGTRLILIGIGVAAMLDSVVTYVLSQGRRVGPADRDAVAHRQPERRDLGRSSSRSRSRASCSCRCCSSQGRGLDMLRLGDDSAAEPRRQRPRARASLLIVAAVALLAFATAASGPIAFVAFMAGPIAARIVGPGGSLLLPAGLVGALLVLVADLVGQFAFDTRYPVGVITGVLGAPYLIYLLIRTNRSGGSL